MKSLCRLFQTFSHFFYLLLSSVILVLSLMHFLSLSLFMFFLRSLFPSYLSSSSLHLLSFSLFSPSLFIHSSYRSLILSSPLSPSLSLSLIFILSLSFSLSPTVTLPFRSLTSFLYLSHLPLTLSLASFPAIRRNRQDKHIGTPAQVPSHGHT